MCKIIALLLALTSFASAEQLSPCKREFGVSKVIAGSDYSKLLFAISTSAVVNSTHTPRAADTTWTTIQVDTTTTNSYRVYAATFQTTDEGRYGMPINSQNEPYIVPWGPNIPIYVWVGDLANGDIYNTTTTVVGTWCR